MKIQQPMRITSKYWCIERPTIESDDLKLGDHTTGKWMLFYPKPQMNAKWKCVVEKFREGSLRGVTSMKCSTAKKNERCNNDADGVMILYVGCDDESQILEIGQNIIDTLDYRHAKFMYFKTEYQTWSGTRATGLRKNHSFKLSTEIKTN